jgi:DNA-binding MarR family transcriptional regulator
MKYSLLTALLPLLDTFEKAFPGEHDPQRFATWLLARQLPAEASLSEESPTTSDKETDEAHLVRHLFFLHRYARSYGRKALESSALGSVDEFLYLAFLEKFGPMGKTDLIQRNRHEKPTGMEIIRRLLDLGLVIQTDDPHDRRSKTLSLTTAGTALLEQATPDMQKIFRLMAGNLSAVERFQLMQMLDKLERFHQVVQARLREKRG